VHLLLTLLVEVLDVEVMVQQEAVAVELVETDWQVAAMAVMHRLQIVALVAGAVAEMEQIRNILVEQEVME
jgi:hypothetical protein